MNKVNSTRKNAAEAVEDVIAEATTKARRLRDAAAKKLDRAPEGDIRTDLRDLVRRHPTAALAGAAMAGAILSGMLLRAGRR
ncbi:hypothetical protein QCN27_07855 [Cereibacter sp. SYSU M97828]|nr:hypothetical protein [Cereibacter flavus]